MGKSLSVARVGALIKRELGAYLTLLLPETLRSRFIPFRYQWSFSDIKTVARPARGDVRLLIAPANYGGQAYQWSRAARTLPGVSAVNLRFNDEGSIIRGPSDFSVKKKVGQTSHLWARRQRKAIKKNFTHVLIEAEAPILGPLYGSDLEAEIKDLQKAGIKVGLVSHGTDTRLPSLHAELEPDSPFHEALGGFTERAERSAKSNLELMDKLDLPEFVSTPDLLQFRPKARWLPGISPLNPWADITPTRLESEKPVVMHVPGRRRALKGTDFIEPAMRRLHDEGLIEYLHVESATREEMAEHMRHADIVVNQVAMGLYATVAIEGMLAGRVVVSQVWDSVRDHIQSQTGAEVPVVEAKGDTVYDVVRHIVENREQYRDLGEKSKEFALQVHSYAHAAQVLQPFLTN